jgi:hypothetical protein
LCDFCCRFKLLIIFKKITTQAQIQHVEHPKYLGVTLDRSLTYNTHLSKTAKKTAARVNLVWKQTVTNWVASAETLLRTASLALVYSTAEYCAPLWLNSSKIDIQLNNTMRLISGTVKSTQLQWLPLVANIAQQNCDVKQPLFVNW